MFRPVSARRWISTWIALGAFAIACGSSGALQAQDQSNDEMAAMMAAMTPGPHHEKMATRTGTWKTHSKMWMQPGQPPMETEGHATLESLMDGRFVQEVTTATMMGMPWEGRGIFGYDNTSKKHVGTWFDSFGTMMMSFEGSCDGTCNVVTLESEYLDPVSKSMKHMRSVSTMKGDDKAVMELYDVAKDGTATRMAEITYTRESGPKQAKR